MVSLLSDVDTATEEERAGERSFMLSTDAFPRATRCSFRHVIFTPNMIPPGAMPMVDDLSFGLLVSDILSGGDWDLCIRNLPSLKKVWIKLYGKEESSERYSEARAAVERAAADHPNRPKARVKYQGNYHKEVRTTFAKANVCAFLFPCIRILLLRIYAAL
jgi:hypothetical protein